MSELIIIGVCGAGAMGAGIAQVAARAGHPVVVFDSTQAALDRGAAQTAASLHALVKRGRLSSDAAVETLARILWSPAIEALAPAGLVIEAIIEDTQAKADLFDRLEAVIADTAVLATNTSSLPVTRLGAARKFPARFLGLHFFNPAPVMKLVEIVSGAATDPSMLRWALELMSAWGKAPVLVRDVPGFIVNRVARPYYAEGFRAWDEEAAPPEAIDALFREGAGFKMGPLELADMIGHDVNFAVASSVHGAYFGACRFTPQLAQGALVDAGRLGRKSGRGVFDYSVSAAAPVAGPRAVPPPKRIVIGMGVSTALAAQAAAIGGEPGSAQEGYLDADGVLIRPSDGRLAATHARLSGRPVALLDWAAESGTARGYAVSEAAASDTAEAFIAAMGQRSIQMADRAGLLVLRTLGQLANAAADAVRDRVAEASGIDDAMRFGANYPFGPLAWAEAYGYAAIVEVMANIAHETGEPVYAPSVFLRGRA